MLVDLSPFPDDVDRLRRTSMQLYGQTYGLEVDLAVWAQDGVFTVNEVAERSAPDVSAQDVRRILERRCAVGVVVRERRGKGRHARYQKVDHPFWDAVAAFGMPLPSGLAAEHDHNDRHGT